MIGSQKPLRSLKSIVDNENNAGQKGAIKTKYLTETGEIKRDYDVKKS